MPEIFPSSSTSEERAFDRPLTDRAVHRGAECQSMVPEKQEEALKGLVEEFPYVQFAYVVNSEGVKITRNITQVVDKAKYAKIDLHEDFSDREWFINPLKTGKISVTTLYTSRITGALCVTVSGPIRDDVGESWASSG
jgi:hypothetical protein